MDENKKQYITNLGTGDVVYVYEADEETGEPITSGEAHPTIVYGTFGRMSELGVYIHDMQYSGQLLEVDSRYIQYPPDGTINENFAKAVAALKGKRVVDVINHDSDTGLAISLVMEDGVKALLQSDGLYAGDESVFVLSIETPESQY